MRPGLTLALCACLWRAPLARAGEDDMRWRRCDRGLQEKAFVAVAIHPLRPARVFAASRLALYESTDGGDEWTERFRLPTGVAIRSLAVGWRCISRTRMGSAITTQLSQYSGSPTGDPDWTSENAADTPRTPAAATTVSGARKLRDTGTMRSSGTA